MSFWSADGRTLFFRGGEDYQEIFAAAIQTEPVFSRSDPESLFEATGPFQISDLHPDGERFAMLRIADTEVAPQINIILNWIEELKERVPGP